MALCEALIGTDANCESNSGGLLKIYIAQYGLITSTTEVAGSLSTITTAGGAAVFHEFSFNRNTCSYTETANISIENGSQFVSQSISLNLARREKVKRGAIQKLMDGIQKLVIIVRDSNGLFWYFGLTDGVTVTAVEGGSGVAKGDANAYVITFLGEEPTFAPEVSSSIISALIV